MVIVLFWVCVAFVFYVYFGYPLLIFVLAAFHKKTNYDSKYTPKVTLLIAAFNEEKAIAEKLENSLSLDYHQDCLQILVADDGSTDGTAKIVQSYLNRGVELVSYSQRKGKLSALNYAMQYARNEIVLLSDADNFYRPETVREIVKPFSDRSVGAVSGSRVVLGMNSLGEAESLYWKYEEFIKQQESNVGSCVGVAGDALAVRRELYPYPPDNVINDDFYIALSILRQGFRVVYAPRAKSYHPVSETVEGEIERRTRIIAGRYQSLFFAKEVFPYHKPILLLQVVSHKYFRALVPYAMIGALTTNILAFGFPIELNLPSWLNLSHPSDRIFLSVQLLFYLLSLIGMKYRMKGFLGKILYIPTFIVNSNFAAIRGFYRHLTKRQSVTWSRVSHSGRTVE